MFVTDLIRDTLTSPTPCRNAIAPEMDVITKFTCLETEKYNYAAVMIWACYCTYYVAVQFLKMC